MPKNKVNDNLNKSSEPKIVMVAVDKLRPCPTNPRDNDNAVEAVANSIKAFGFKQPIVVDGNGEIICGHTRYKASIKLELKQVPCIIATDLTPEQIRAYRLADNKTNELAEWNIDLLNFELAELSELDIDMSEFGFDSIDPIGELDQVTEDNIPDTPAELTAKVGDVYQLGNHRLVCGDCTDESIIAKLMNGEIADIVVTDPPYNTDIGDLLSSVAKSRHGGKNNDGTKSKKIAQYKEQDLKNDKMPEQAYGEFLQKAFAVMDKHLKAGGALYCCYSMSESVNYFTNFKKFFVLYQSLIWVKHHFVLGHTDYHYRHEPIIYGYKAGATKYFAPRRDQDTVIEDSTIDFKKMTKTEAVSMLKDILQNDNQPTTVIYENKPENSEDHPTIKPNKLFARFISNSSRKNEIVLDPFGGSGTTLIVAEQLGRQARLCELEPKYVDVIISRWEKLTGNKAVKI